MSNGDRAGVVLGLDARDVRPGRLAAAALSGTALPGRGPRRGRRLRGCLLLCCMGIQTDC